MDSGIQLTPIKDLIRPGRTKVMLSAASAQIAPVALDAPGPPLLATSPKSVSRHMYDVGACHLTRERALVANTVAMLVMTTLSKRRAAPLPVVSTGGVLRIYKYDCSFIIP